MLIPYAINIKIIKISAKNLNHSYLDEVSKYIINKIGHKNFSNEI